MSTIKLRRSSVAGRVPTIAQLELGEIAINTADGKLYFKKYDAVLAMYHDQGLPVLKYAGFGHSVNVTLGLPITRSSPDHGTAFGIAGQNLADPGAMIAACGSTS